ncbi:N-acetyl-1-D-myo-inositol-2-amino-2-deoxy-alpha-D-glucopyranoside deacetylase [Nocardia sp. NPDC051570]|uniref:N-acetyl-1-D-myo-inositol-2-amino-2-deoxy-alpha- D-glucopyranoside deacetylase n=1 Tax=Nocardia sp. NPDC051570 TaxID=3364324 RepID=UPI0037954ADA
MLLVHAHPDDESITTGGTIAYYSQRGFPVTVVTCTLGEAGNVIGDQYAQLVQSAADQLGGYRIGELTAALAELGAEAPLFLGGAGRWRDTGVVGTPSGPTLPASVHPRAFATTGSNAVQELVQILLEVRPLVVVGYDPNGGYRHPDHLRAHQITMAAVDSAAEMGWQTPKVYWSVTDEAVLQSHLEALRTAGQTSATLPPEWRLPRRGELASVPSWSVTTTIDLSDVLEVKLAAMRAHATQISVAPSGRAFALSNQVAQPVLPEEHFTLVRGRLGTVLTDGRERDLFAGLASRIHTG